jgi:hypothetical protein
MQLQPILLSMNNLMSGRLFRIPEYQRAYAWGKKQRQDLFADIKRVKTSNEDHFMATVVGLTRETTTIIADRYAVVDIVDGQQRLTTLIILLKAIHKSLNRTDKTELKLADELNDLLIKGDKHRLLLLQANQDTSHIFVDYIREGVLPAGDIATSADQNILDAIFSSETFVSEWKESIGSLVELIGILRNRLYMIFFSIEDEGLVYRVFEVLNSRGLDVSWIDKLKSQLMAKVFELGPNLGREEAIKELHLIWQEIFTTIAKRSHLMTETVRFAGTLKAESLPSRPTDEEKSVQTLVALAGTKPKQIIDCAKWVHAITKAEDRLLAHPRWRAVTRILQARLVAIAVLLRGLPAAEESEVLGRWERVSFRIYGFAGEDARTKVGEYTRLAWSIINEKLSSKEILKRLSEIGKDYPIGEVIEGFDPSNCYDNWGEELRYFIYRYDEHLAVAAGEKLNEAQWNKIWLEEPAKSIEHIKPQKSAVSYLHHLGNLTMLPPGVNSKLKDKDPELKLQTYETCGLRSSIEVAKLLKKEKWGKTVVEGRASKLLQWAKTQWKD